MFPKQLKLTKFPSFHAQERNLCALHAVHTFLPPPGFTLVSADQANDVDPAGRSKALKQVGVQVAPVLLLRAIA
jgi:hypothetical protein